ncbi:MAG: hypothetical protein F4153_09475 [Acidimicrobiia bacterium]|nr:hypothetical protein [Acidimicrobiia bacterium]
MIRRIADKAADLVNAASPIASEISLSSAAKSMRNAGRWLDQRNSYGRQDMINVLKNKDIDAKRLGEYIACSAPLHLSDGWNYLSRAFEAALRGDRSSSYHLAYYAELRAAMSLLATEGIGIFDRQHIAIDAQMLTTQFQDSTHQATWKLLKAWSERTDSAVRFLDSIMLESRSLSEWLEAAGVVEPSRSLVAREWLLSWSVDLELFSKDQSRRNEMSYRPTRIRSHALTPVNPDVELVDPLYNSWAELRPTIAGAEAALDVSLLRRALLFAMRKGLCTHRKLDRALASFSQLEPPLSPLTSEELETESESAKAIFEAAQRNRAKETTVTPILARALLMLRLASASTSSLLKAAQISKSDLEFWWAPLGTDLGFWDAADDIDLFSDLWADVQEAHETAEKCILELSGNHSMRSVAGCLTSKASLTQFSRTPMWLLGLD